MKITADFLLKNKKNLPKGIFADQEDSEEVECERWKLRPILRRAKQLPEYKMKSKVEGGKLVIQGKRYTTKSLHLLPERLIGYNVSKKEDTNHIGFIGELNPLLNFHEASFGVDWIKFNSSEQYIQYQKAKLFSDERAIRKILESSTALECKSISKEIINFDPIVWRDCAASKCEEGITAKFVQNPVLLKLLVSTGDKVLVECAYDHLWGSGIPMHEENCFKEQDWSGENLLGKLLMKVRDDNRDIIGDNVECMDT